MFVMQVSKVRQPKIGDEAKVVQREPQELVKPRAMLVRETGQKGVAEEKVVEKKSLYLQLHEAGEKAFDAVEKAVQKAVQKLDVAAAYFGAGVAAVGVGLMAYATNAGIAGIGAAEALSIYAIGMNTAVLGAALITAGATAWTLGKAWQWWEGRNADRRKSE